MVAEYNSLVPPKQAVCMDSILDTEHPWPWQITQSGMHFMYCAYSSVVEEVSYLLLKSMNYIQSQNTNTTQ